MLREPSRGLRARRRRGLPRRADAGPGGPLGARRRRRHPRTHAARSWRCAGARSPARCRSATAPTSCCRPRNAPDPPGGSRPRRQPAQDRSGPGGPVQAAPTTPPSNVRTSVSSTPAAYVGSSAAEPLRPGRRRRAGAARRHRAAGGPRSPRGTSGPRRGRRRRRRSRAAGPRGTARCRRPAPTVGRPRSAGTARWGPSTPVIRPSRTSTRSPQPGLLGVVDR